MAGRRSRIRAWFSGFRSAPPPRWTGARPACTHVILLDGTMSSLRRGEETNIGLTYRLLSELGPDAAVTVYYEPGIQWRGWSRAVEVVAGVGIDRQIKRAYLFLARNYHPGDKIFLMGFSRGAYAVRSLAGLIDALGLLRAAQVDEATLERVYALYRTDPGGAEAKALKSALCHARLTIDFLGVFDTVRALGLRWPLIWRWMRMPHPYHSHALGPTTAVARHALALDETREVFAPVLWQVKDDRAGAVQQMWFRGSHGDIGGQLGGRNWARGLSNIPLVWMLEEAERQGLALPVHWRSRFLTNPKATSVGTRVGWGKFFLDRRRRAVGRDPSERLHPTAQAAAMARGLPPALGAGASG